VVRKGVAEGRELVFDRTKFKMANLDTLMFSNDKVLKLENNVEGFLKKIDKQYCELEEKQAHDWYVRGGDR
jgi:SH3-like domain-containing protein